MIPVEDRQILHLGSGNKYNPEAVNLDLTAATKPDIVHDLNQHPWPFPDDRFSALIASDVIEHMKDTVATMEEIHRVCSPGAIAHIVVPHFSAAGAFRDPTHYRYFSALTFDYFTENHELNFYSRCRFRPRNVQIIFHPTLINKIVWRLANRYKEPYEKRWTWMFPAFLISAELEIIK